MPPPTVRIAKIAAAAIAAVLSLFLLSLAFFNTGYGLGVAEQIVASLSNGTVTVKGLGGRFPDSLTAEHVEVSDPGGVWLIAEGAAIDWSPLALWNNRVAVESANIAHVRMLRLPEYAPEETASENPVIAIAAYSISRLDLEPPVADSRASLTLSGMVRYRSLERMRVNINAQRLDIPAAYRIDMKVGRRTLAGDIDIREPDHGIISVLLGLPDLGPLTIRAEAKGPATSDNITLAISTGALNASVNGNLDLKSRNARLDVFAQSPAMAPAPDLSWDGFALQARLAGALDAPDAEGHFTLTGLTSGGFSSARVAATIAGHAGKLDLNAEADAVQLAGRAPDLLASAPVRFRAITDLSAKTPRIDFALAHPFLRARGNFQNGDTRKLTAHLALPDLAPFSALADVALEGSAAFDTEASIDDTGTTLAASGTLSLTTGDLAALIGRDGKFSLSLTRQGEVLTLDSLILNGDAIAASATGTRQKAMNDFSFKATLADASRLVRSLNGHLDASGSLKGADDDLAAIVHAEGSLATTGKSDGPIEIALAANGLPDALTGTLDVNGTFDGSSVQLASRLSRASGDALRLDIQMAHWRSLEAGGNITLGEQASGRLQIQAGNLADVSSLIGTGLAGRASATVDMTHVNAKPVARVTLEADGLQVESVRAARLGVSGDIADPFGARTYALRLSGDGVQLSGWHGTMEARLNGPDTALGIDLRAALQDAAGAPAHIDTSAMFDSASLAFAVSKFAADYQDRHLTLAAPAKVSVRDGVAVDGLHAKLDGADLTASGQILPALNLQAAATNVSADALREFLPGIALAGTFQADAALTGTLEAPEGDIRLEGRDLNMAGGAINPAATLSARATLHGQTMALNAHLTNGATSNVSLSGTAPLQEHGAVSLKAAGMVDLALLDPFLNARGRSLKGQLALDAHIGGTFSDPRIAGSGTLNKGEFRDYVNGVRLAAMTAKLDADGDVINVRDLSARAGEGAITGNGRIDLGTPGIPVNIALTAQNARPLSSDKLTADVNANLTLHGNLKERLTLSGGVHVTRGEIAIPESFAGNVQTLDVRRKGQKPPPPPSGLAPVIALDVKVNAPDRVFVRGRGVDAEVSGDFSVSGTTQSPQFQGALTMRRGELDLGGHRIEFTSGRVTFNGQGLSDRFDPVLDFAAESTSGSITAKLAITGYASHPAVLLSSTPQLPQDEVLAQLLFQQSVKQLSPFQLAEMAQVLASLGGLDTGFGNPLARVRKSLGLDRLAVSSATEGGEAQVEAGKYLSRGIYVGAKQGLNGSTQGQVQVDLTKGLKLKATVSAAASATGTTTTTPDQTTSVGLSYQFEY